MVLQHGPRWPCANRLLVCLTTRGVLPALARGRATGRVCRRLQAALMLRRVRCAALRSGLHGRHALPAHGAPANHAGRGDAQPPAALPRGLPQLVQGEAVLRWCTLCLIESEGAREGVGLPRGLPQLVQGEAVLSFPVALLLLCCRRAEGPATLPRGPAPALANRRAALPACRCAFRVTRGCVLRVDTGPPRSRWRTSAGARTPRPGRGLAPLPRRCCRTSATPTGRRSPRAGGRAGAQPRRRRGALGRVGSLA